jgi:hypothetical protein
MKRPRIGMNIKVRTDLAPHPLDREIIKLARDLRRLIMQRASTLKAVASSRKRSDETRQRISASMTGKKHTAEARANMAAAQLGYKQTPAHRAANSRGQLARRREQ